MGERDASTDMVRSSPPLVAEPSCALSSSQRTPRLANRVDALGEDAVGLLGIRHIAQESFRPAGDLVHERLPRAGNSGAIEDILSQPAQESRVSPADAQPDNQEGRAATYDLVADFSLGAVDSPMHQELLQLEKGVEPLASAHEQGFASDDELKRCIRRHGTFLMQRGQSRADASAAWCAPTMRSQRALNLSSIVHLSGWLSNHWTDSRTPCAKGTVAV
jgi:hypothetical protein